MNLTNSTILIADGDRDRRETLSRNLELDGYEVLTAATVATARQFLSVNDVDLAILSRDVAGADGLDLLRMIRTVDPDRPRLDSNLPVLIISERGNEFETLRCFEFGCDDLLTVPYRYSELRARVRALLRRFRHSAVPLRLCVGPLEIDTLGRRVWVYGQLVPLSRKEFSLLWALAINPGRVHSREELMTEIWGWSDSLQVKISRTLDSHASRLRRKLAIGGADFVVNVWGIGYKLTEMFAPEADAQIKRRGGLFLLPGIDAEADAALAPEPDSEPCAGADVAA